MKIKKNYDISNPIIIQKKSIVNKKYKKNNF